MNIPNKLTIGRVLAIPVFIVVLMLGYNFAAAVIFILAAITDYFDGMLARRCGLVTNFGKIMDPLADKLLVMAAFVCLVELGEVVSWMVIVILSREFIVTGLRIAAAAQGVVIAAELTGKIKTVLQMIAIPALILNNWPFCLIGLPFAEIMLWAAVIMTVISGVEYIAKNKRFFGGKF